MFDSQSGEDKVRKFVLLLTLTTSMSGTAMAEGWDFSQSGTAGLYYGITEDRDRHILLIIRIRSLKSNA